jgi:hypothetical protein
MRIYLPSPTLQTLEWRREISDPTYASTRLLEQASKMYVTVSHRAKEHCKRAKALFMHLLMSLRQKAFGVVSGSIIMAESRLCYLHIQSHWPTCTYTQTSSSLIVHIRRISIRCLSWIWSVSMLANAPSASPLPFLVAKRKRIISGH